MTEQKKLSGYQNRIRKAGEDAKKEFIVSKCRKIDEIFVREIKHKAAEAEKCADDNVRDTSDRQPELENLVTECDDTDIQVATSHDSTIVNEPNAQKQQGTGEGIRARTSRLDEESSVEEKIKIDLATFTDPAKWTINEDTRCFIVSHGVQQNDDVDFSASSRVYNDKVRYLSTDLFKRKMKNGEVQHRSWLVYSKSTGCVYCVPCMLFATSPQETAFTQGFNDWKNATYRVERHENSTSHKDCVVSFKRRASASGRVDCELANQLESEIAYWRNVLHRVCETVKSLAIRGLPFRGDDEHFGSAHNGNFLASLELIAQFDPFLARHIEKYGEKGSGHVSYLSKETYDEFISVMGDKVQKSIVDEVKHAKYYGIIVDSTPDISHIDQLTLVVRYVLPTGEPKERFLCFLPNTGHKSEQLSNAVVAKLNELGLKLEDIRGQSYDNASNMSGAYSGLQARIANLNPLAFYVPCAAHSLNLVGTCAAESCPEAARFFLTLQELYNFFTASTHRWEIITTYIKRVLKSLSVTRWSARSEACQALQEGWKGVIEALTFVSEDVNQKALARNEAKGLLKNLLQLETAILVVAWNTILDRFNKTSKKLQKVSTNLGCVVECYASLAEFVHDLRENVHVYEAKAKEMTGIEAYSYDLKRKPRRKAMSDETTEGEYVASEGSEHFRVNVFYVIVDSLSIELKKRSEAYTRVHTKFDFLENLSSLAAPAITKSVDDLVATYKDDLEPILSAECLHLKAHLNCLHDKPSVKSATELSTFLNHNAFSEVYPNVNIALRMLLSTPVTNCSGERSFSALKRVKNYLRSSMTEEKLNSLAILSIESDLTKSTHYDDVIDLFVSKRARKKSFR